jgi:hypothetical protein
MKVKRKLSDFSVKKRKRNKNMKTKTEICGNGNGNFLAKVAIERFRQNRCGKRKFLFATNTEFPFNGYFVWPI